MPIHLLQANRMLAWETDLDNTLEGALKNAINEKCYIITAVLIFFFVSAKYFKDMVRVLSVNGSIVSVLVLVL